MHSVFQVDEIFSTIINFIYEDSSLCTLTAVARTCRSFQDPALDALWRNQPSLVPILRCLSDAVTQHPFSDGCALENPPSPTAENFNKPQIVLHLAREPSCEEWARFCSYASRIRWLDADFTRDRIDDTLLFTLSSRHQLLFPNLRTLIWIMSNDRKVNLNIAQPFLSRRLTRIFLCCPGSAMHPPLIDYMATNCPFLKDFYLHCNWCPELSAVMENLYHRSRTLHIVNCRAPLDPVVWHELANHPHLRSITVPIATRKREAASSGVSFAQVLATFPALEDLNLSTSTFSTLADLLATSLFPKLRTIRLDIQTYKSLPRKYFSRLVNTIAVSCAAADLSSIAIYSSHIPSEDREPNHSILPDSLGPLLSFRNLRSITISARWCYDLDDAIIRDMAAAWPNITHLWLDPSGQWPAHSRVTLEGLLPLAERCPNLCTLGVVVHANLIMPHGSALRPGRGHVHHRLRTLMVGNAYINSPCDTAAFLSDIFPALERIDSWLECSPGRKVYKDRWDEVGKLIHYFTRVRMQERNWMQFVHFAHSSQPNLTPSEGSTSTMSPPENTSVTS